MSVPPKRRLFAEVRRVEVVRVVTAPNSAGETKAGQKGQGKKTDQKSNTKAWPSDGGQPGAKPRGQTSQCRYEPARHKRCRKH